MKSLFFYLLCLVPSISLAQSGYAVYGIPDDLRLNADAVIRNSSETFRVLDASKAIFRERYVVTILNKEAENWATLYVHYDEKMDKVLSVEGKKYNSSGKLIGEIKKKDIKDGSPYDGFSVAQSSRYKMASLSQGTYPYTVEFEYEIEKSNLMFYHLFTPQPSQRVSVQKATFDIILPESLQPLRFKTNQTAEPDISTLEEGKKRYRWQEQNIKVQSLEIISPPWFEQKKYVITSPNSFKVEDYEGNSSTWESIGESQNKLNAGRSTLPEATKQKVRELTAGISDNFEKIRVLYEYMQSKTRYVSIQLGLGGWQPFPAEEVDKKGYGDCKALSNYMKSLLAEVGIESHYTIIGAGDDRIEVNPDFPARIYFNHIILCVPNQKDTVWLECTSQKQAAGYLGNFTNDRYGLVVTENGGKLLKTPKYGTKENQIIRTAQVKLEPTGKAQAEIRTVYQGLEQDRNYRDYFAQLSSKEDQIKWLNKTLKINDFDIKNFELQYQKSRLPKVQETLSLDLPLIGSLSGKRLFLQPNVFNKWETNLPQDSSRKQPVELRDYDWVQTDSIWFELPPDFHLENRPETIQFDSPFGKYESSAVQKDRKVLYLRRLEIRNGRYKATQYEDLRQFFFKIHKADRSKWVLVGNT